MTLTISTDSSSALRDADRAGRPGRRVPVGRHHEPARSSSTRAWPTAIRSTFAGNKLTIVVPTSNPAGITSAGGPREGRRQGHRRRRRGADHQVRDPARGRTSPKEAGYPADFVAAYTANIVSKEDNVKALDRQDRARRGRRRHRLRHRRQGLDQGHDDRRPGRGERARDLRRRGRQGVEERRPRPGRSSTGSPARTARRSWAASGSCRRRDRGPGRHRTAQNRSMAVARLDAANDAGVALARSSWSPASSRCSSGCRSSRSWRARSSTGRSAARSVRRPCSTALRLSLVDDRDQPRG